MVNLTFWTCVKIVFGITLGYHLEKELWNTFKVVAIKIAKLNLHVLEVNCGKDDDNVKKLRKILSVGGVSTKRKQPIGFRVTNKHE